MQVRRQAQRVGRRAGAGGTPVHVDRRPAARSRAEPGAERELAVQRLVPLGRVRHARQRARQNG